MFDWNQEFENEMMETYNSNAFGLTTSDFQDAHDFLKNSKLDLQDGKDGNEIVGEAWGGEKYSLRGMVSYSNLTCSEKHVPCSS